MVSEAISPAIELMLTIEPGWWSFIKGIAVWQPRNTESTLTAKPRFQSSSVQVSILPRTPIPALLSSTDSPPSRSRAISTAAFHCSGLVTSSLQENAVSAPNAALIVAAVSAAPASLTSVHNTRAPSRASIMALAAPSPCAAPVTKASLPATLPAIPISSARTRSSSQYRRPEQQ